MKTSTLKTMIVHLAADNIIEIEVDADIFDDPEVEAATQALEYCKLHNRFGVVRPIIECWDKKDNKSKKHPLLNSYWILINAACHKKAELLREKFKQQHDVDLREQPLRGSVK